MVYPTDYFDVFPRSRRFEDNRGFAGLPFRLERGDAQLIPLPRSLEPRVRDEAAVWRQRARLGV